MKKLIGIILSFVFVVTTGLNLSAQASTSDFTITELSVIDSGAGLGGAEIPTFHKGSNRIFTTNGADNTIDVYDITDPENPVEVTSVSLDAYGDGITSVAAGKYVIAVALAKDEEFEADGTPIANDGVLVVMLPNGGITNVIELGGVLPDSVTFTPDGLTAMVAIEGEPICALDNPATSGIDESTDYNLAVDPMGGVAIVDLENPYEATAKMADFSKFRSADLKRAGIVVSNTAKSAIVDLEPEYVTASNNTTAYVTVQEANAIAEIDLATAKFTRIFSAGTVDHSVVPFDSSNSDNGAGQRTYDNVKGLAMPDMITAYEEGGNQYLLTANEGDGREYTCFPSIDDGRAKDLTVDPTAFPNWATQGEDDELGRSKINPNIGDDDGDGDYDRIFTLGSRSFSIFENNKRIYDSEDLFEELQISALGVENINSSWDIFEGTFEPQDRSDDKGAEPEGVTQGMVDDSRVAVIGMERMSALLFMDITDPANPSVIEWKQFLPAEDVVVADQNKWSPEGLVWIDAADSPNGKPLLVTSYEVSGTLSIHSIEK